MNHLTILMRKHDVYSEQKSAELQAVERKLASVDKQRKKLEMQAQRNREKADHHDFSRESGIQIQVTL
ncbi:hypothetical protein [uncultured Vibrio sp.]|uniref:hypothetical protein n=1 Tax=uncultured Vibrio sp. TaxID=114054 RepID=UPI0029C8ADFF|nr:hypothetical protein [uncultured Vibrio sp.]